MKTLLSYRFLVPVALILGLAPGFAGLADGRRPPPTGSEGGRGFPTPRVRPRKRRMNLQEEVEPVMDKPLVSVIIPHFNDEENLGKCLRGLESQNYPTELFEILVVDNGSDKAPKEQVEGFRNAALLFESQVGSYAARNRGITRAKGEILAFIDSDCLPDPDWLGSGVEALTGDPEIAVVGGRVTFSFADPRRLTPVELFDSISSFNQKDYIEKSSFSGTGNLFTYRRVFDEVGLFDPQHKSGGDYEWGTRVSGRGLKVAYSEATQVAHPARKSLDNLCRKHRRVIGGHVQLRRNLGHYGWVRIVQDLVGEFFGYFDRSGKILKIPSVGFALKARTLGVATLVSSLRMMERVRVSLGGEPLR